MILKWKQSCKTFKIKALHHKQLSSLQLYKMLESVNRLYYCLKCCNKYASCHYISNMQISILTNLHTSRCALPTIINTHFDEKKICQQNMIFSDVSVLVFVAFALWTESILDFGRALYTTIPGATPVLPLGLTDLS